MDKCGINPSAAGLWFVDGSGCTGLLWIPASQPGWEACWGVQHRWKHLPAGAGPRPQWGGHGCRGLVAAGYNPCLLCRLLGRTRREGLAGISVLRLQTHPKVVENNLDAVPASSAGELRLLDLV